MGGDSGGGGEERGRGAADDGDFRGARKCECVSEVRTESRTPTCDEDDFSGGGEGGQGWGDGWVGGCVVGFGVVWERHCVSFTLGVLM